MSTFPESPLSFLTLEVSSQERQRFWVAMGTSVIAEAVFTALIVLSAFLVVAEPLKMSAYAKIPLISPLDPIRLPVKSVAANSRPSLNLEKKPERSSRPVWVSHLASPIVTTAGTTRVAPQENLQITETPLVAVSLRIPESVPQRPVELGVLSQSTETGDAKSRIGRKVDLGGSGNVSDGTGLGNRPGKMQIITQGSFGSLESPERKLVQTAPQPPPDERPEILAKPVPRYTEDARAHRIEGDVLVAVRFHADGIVTVLAVKRGVGYGLEEEAIRAAEQIKFRPAFRAGAPVDCDGVVRIEFRLAY